MLFPKKQEYAEGGTKFGGEALTIRIDIELLKKLIEQPDSLAKAADSPGFKLYWLSLGRGHNQAIAELQGQNARIAALAQEDANGKSILSTLGRISGSSIEQQVIRHLPAGITADATVEFVPGGDLPLVAEGNLMAVNFFAIEQRNNKLFVGDFPLLSFLANRIHQLLTAKLALPLIGAGGAFENFLCRMLREGSATLFFTLPVSGPVFSLWQQAEKRREEEVQLLRRSLHAQDRNSALVRELEFSLSLPGSAALAARYPLGAWMCQVIEGAFGRDHLVALLQRPQDFVADFEQARTKFGLPDKYSLAAPR